MRTSFVFMSAAMLGLARACPAEAPDIIGGAITGSSSYGGAPEMVAYSFGIEPCNIGTLRVQFSQSTPLHPIAVENIYRLSQGRFEQIGMGWVYHYFCAASQEELCGTCEPDPNCHLGVGCSTLKTAPLLGSQSNLGQRSQVNASTAGFPYPYSTPPFSGPIVRRVQVPVSEIDPTQNPGAQYFAEVLHLSPDDSAAGNAANNASYRRFTVSPALNLTLTGATSQEAPAILAWAAADPGVVVNVADVAGDGRFYVASKATQIACNRYRYEYAVYNLNSDRSAGSFTVPFAAPGIAVNISFHDISYHSGEPYSGADWPALPGACGLSWATEDFATNANANAIRWGTLYNFRFETHWAPVSANAEIALFKPGSPSSVSFGVIAPGSAAAFAGDYTGDGQVGLADAAFLINHWFDPCAASGVSGMAEVINHWAEICP